MISDKYMSRIKKCLELSSSSNAYEAAVALKRAKKLMKKYGLSDDDITLLTVGKTESNTVVPEALPVYLSQLICKISDIYNCCAMQKRKSNSYFVLYIGSSAEAQLAAYTFDVLHRQLILARDAYLTKEDSNTNTDIEIDAFCHGWVTEVCENIESKTLNDEKKNLFLCYASKTENVSQESASTKEEIKIDNKSKTIFAMLAGMAKAKKITLNQAVETRNTEEISHNLW